MKCLAWSGSLFLGQVSPSFGPPTTGPASSGSLVQADDPWCGYAHPNLE